jgi:hypothetical protein
MIIALFSTTQKFARQTTICQFKHLGQMFFFCPKLTVQLGPDVHGSDACAD